MRQKSSADQSRGVLSRQAGIWLATLSTVVGVATGMFTLRDQVFPREASTATAMSASVYQDGVGEVCEQLNTAERARARGDRALARRLRRAKTTIEQRNALLDAVRRESARAAYALAAFDALDPAKAVAAKHRFTKAAWDCNLDRVRAYRVRLDSASNRAQLNAATKGFTRERSALARDGVRITSGLQRLGEGNCRVGLPPLPRRSRYRPSTARAKPGINDALIRPVTAAPTATGTGLPPRGQTEVARGAAVA